MTLRNFTFLFTLPTFFIIQIFWNISHFAYPDHFQHALFSMHPILSKLSWWHLEPCALHQTRPLGIWIKTSRPWNIIKPGMQSPWAPEIGIFEAEGRSDLELKMVGLWHNAFRVNFILESFSKQSYIFTTHFWIHKRLLRFFLQLQNRKVQLQNKKMSSQSWYDLKTPTS